MKLKKVFQRKETKYLLTQEQFTLFFEELQHYMEIDEYGLHTILSLYFDTEDFRFIQKSMQKPKYKEKFRVRSYGVPRQETPVFLEIKKKVKGIVYKRRVATPYNTYTNWLHEKIFKETAEAAPTQIEKEINWLFKKNKDLEPRVLIAYDRLSMFTEEDSEFRVTFDQKIRFRSTKLDLMMGSGGELVAPEIGVLMEVKAMGAYPLWFVHLLNKHAVRKGSFSKYAETYKRHLFTRTQEEENYVV